MPHKSTQKAWNRSEWILEYLDIIYYISGIFSCTVFPEFWLLFDSLPVYSKSLISLVESLHV